LIIGDIALDNGMEKTESLEMSILDAVVGDAQEVRSLDWRLKYRRHLLGKWSKGSGELKVSSHRFGCGSSVCRRPKVYRVQLRCCGC
jgi:hypothetical protein